MSGSGLVEADAGSAAGAGAGAGRAEAVGAVRITPYRDGPLLVRGPIVLCDQEGNEIEVRQRTVALCRCGRSRRKPFCDGMHKAVGWRAPSEPQLDPDDGA